MADSQTLRKPWICKGSYLNKMLNAGSRYNGWIQQALRYLPDNIFDQLKDKLLFISSTECAACRIPRSVAKNREIILLSERIMPERNAEFEQSNVRYFIFCVLHEIAHALKNHLSPTLDNLDRQEAEANELALNWFNAAASPYERELTIEEIKEQEKYFKDLIEEDLKKKRYEIVKPSYCEVVTTGPQCNPKGRD